VDGPGDEDLVMRIEQKSDARMIMNGLERGDVCEEAVFCQHED
jgi:hypothetical protein